jgi:hypothetical protein
LGAHGIKKWWLEVIFFYLVVVAVWDVDYFSHGAVGVDLVLDYLAPDLGDFAHIREEVGG